MATQNYLIVEENVVTNTVLWDGNTDTWQPPADSIQLVQATTMALLWEAVTPITDPVVIDLKEVLGAGAIGFTWDGTVLTTNQPKPIGLAQPITTGMQTLGA